ncbi:MAG TPA: serine hydrolase domain-containing protein, partial [Pyrinomonadaceae bacterium]|nr:serine hydrolase domain-containing protein [Pyrinomonadaceae bacterium]
MRFAGSCTGRRSSLRVVLLSLLFIFQLSFAASGFAQGDGERAELPASPVGRVAGALLKALNGGEQTAQLDFVHTNFSEQSLKETPPGAWLAFFKKLHQQSGGLDVMQISPDSNERFLVLDVRSRRGNHWARMFFSLSREQPGKLSNVGMFGIRDPQLEQGDAWPQSKMSEADALKEIKRRVERLAGEDRFSGVVLVGKGDRIIFRGAYGMAEKSFGVANRVDTKFNLGSMNKMFTAVAIAQLVEAGRLSFQDTLAKVLPEYPNRQVAEKVTIHHLLTHTAGLGDFFDNPEFRPYRERYVKPADYFPLFAGRPLRFEPGARFGYSNAGFVVLGAIVERVSGQSYFDYVREHIYRPAGMTESDSYELTEVVPNLAVGYARFQDDPLGVDPRRSNIAFLPWRGSPAGGGYASAPDLLKFARALSTHKLLGAQMTELVTTAKVA